MRAVLFAGSLSLIVAGAAGSAQESSSTQLQKLYAEYLDACMKDWDTATHMTKEEWRRTCQRVANERARFRAEQDGDVKPKQSQ
jgi:hypothetical protein